MSIFNRPSPPTTPTTWDLSDFASWAYDGVPSPEEHQAALEKGPEAHFAFVNQPRNPTLKNPEDLKQAFDGKVEEIAEALRHIRRGFEEQVKHPDATKLLDLFTDTEEVNQETNLAAHFCARYQNAHFKVEGVSAFIEHTQKQWDEKVNPLFRGMFDDLALPIPTIEGLVAEEPELRKFIGALLPERQSQQEPSAPPSPEEELGDDPSKANFYKLFVAINSDTKMPVEEKAVLATRMFNAKVFQSQHQAAQKGTTPLEAFSLENGVTEDFSRSYLEQVLQLNQELKQKNDLIPKVEGAGQIYSWLEAVDIVTTAFSKFHPQMGEIAKTAFAERWMDNIADDKKTSGEWTYRMPHFAQSATRHASALTHFRGDSYSVKTLGHELTHVISHYLANEGQPLQDGRMILPAGQEAVCVERDGSHTPLEATEAQPNESAPPGALGEMFSHFSEKLVQEELLLRSKTPARKQALEQKKRSEILERISPPLAAFEHRLYEKMSKAGAPLSKQDIISCMPRKPNPETDNQALVSYASISHLINNAPHYYLSYPLAELGAVNLADRYQSLDEAGKKDFSEKWISVMREGNKQNFGMVMDEMGVRLADIDKALEPVRKIFTPAQQKATSRREAKQIGFAAKIEQERSHLGAVLGRT